MSRFKFFEEEGVEVEKVLKTEVAVPAVEESVEHTKYRCEQTVVTKVNGVVANHAETKREFHVKKIVSSEGVIVNVVMTDNIINLNPPQLQEAIALIGEVDYIKCNVNVLLDNETGKIKKVLNHQEVVSNWNAYKEDLYQKSGFIQEEESQKKLSYFISLAEAQIVNEGMLIADLNTKLFFDVFFDQYLVRHANINGAYTRVFFSQLFEGEPATLDIEQLIMNETPDRVTISKVGKMDRSKLDLNKILKIYEERFKPMIQYKFSEFNFSYTERCLFNRKTRLIEDAQVSIVEEIKNNIQVLINYHLKQIE